VARPKVWTRESQKWRAEEAQIQDSRESDARGEPNPTVDHHRRCNPPSVLRIKGKRMETVAAKMEQLKADKTGKAENRAVHSF